MPHKRSDRAESVAKKKKKICRHTFDNCGHKKSTAALLATVVAQMKLEKHAAIVAAKQTAAQSAVRCGVAQLPSKHAVMVPLFLRS